VRFVFILDDFGLQFRLGNGPYADGRLMAYLQPNLNVLEFEKFRRLGELAYAEDCRRQAFDWIREHPERFAVISLKRFVYCWAGVPKESGSTALFDFRNSLFLATSVLAIWGLARHRKKRSAWLLLPESAYPTTYYCFPRIPAPVEPDLLIPLCS
jgi:hypothetical protein